MSSTPGRNNPCPCGSGRKFKQCCLQNWTAESSARLRLRGAEGRVVDAVLAFAAERWGEPLLAHAWEDFWDYEDVPEDLTAAPEFGTMFIPWFAFEFVPDRRAEGAADDWPRRPIGLEWLETYRANTTDLDREYIETACRSPMSVFAIEQVAPGRSLDLKDVLTGSRFHVLEVSASQTVRPADLLFSRVLTVEGTAIMLGASPFAAPPRWHLHVIDWREQLVGKRLMTRRDLAKFDREIRNLYFEIVAELLDPTPPQLCNTDGDPLELTTLTYDVRMRAGEMYDALLTLAVVHGDEHSEVTRDASGGVANATLSWVTAGNRQHKNWDNTVLGRLRLEAGRLVAEVNSTRRANRLKREVAKRLGRRAVLVNTDVVDPTEALEERMLQGAMDEGPGEQPPLESSPELQAVEEEMNRRHWESWLDTRVPALRNKTPRQAVQTPAGRERLEALLADFERHADTPWGAAHLTAVRHALGLSKPGE